MRNIRIILSMILLYLIGFCFWFTKDIVAQEVSFSIVEFISNYNNIVWLEGMDETLKFWLKNV